MQHLIHSSWLGYDLDYGRKGWLWVDGTIKRQVIIFVVIESQSKLPFHNNKCIMHFVTLLALDPSTTYVKINKGMQTQLSTT